VDDGKRGVREIAQLAGVSAATVSRVYRGVGQVAPQTREKVLQAIQQYGYRPSPFGLSLARQQHGTIGIVLPGLSGPYFGELLEGFDSVAVERDVSVHVIGAHRRASADQELDALTGRVDGVAVHAGLYPDDVLDRVAARVPVLLIGDGGGRTSVRSDHSAMRDLVAHLVQAHRARRLVFVGRPAAASDVAERFAFYRSACADFGVEDAGIVEVGLQQTDGALAAPQVAALCRDGVDGAVCANDETALGLILGLAGEGIHVPADLAVTGVDDVPMSSLVRPALTTLARPLREIAATAARSLLDLVAGRTVPTETVLPSTVALRQSCGCGEPSAGRGRSDRGG